MALAIIEVKRDGEPLATSTQQMEGYMKSISNKGPTNLKGYIIMRETTYVFDMPASAGVGAEQSGVLNTARDLKGSLEVLAQAHW